MAGGVLSDAGLEKVMRYGQTSGKGLYAGLVDRNAACLHIFTKLIECDSANSNSVLR